MMDIDEKTKCFQGAFVLARTDRPLTKANIEVFKKLRGFLDDDIVDKIDNFKPGRKGILLIGDDFDLLDGIVSYIWYKHPLIYPMVGNEVTGNALWSCLAYKNAAGHKEHAITDFLFSKNLLSHMHGGILFLKNINPTYTDLLERIVGTLQDVNCRPFIQEKRSRIIRHSSIEDEIYDFDDQEIQRREELPKFKRMPGILVMSVKKRPPAEYLRQFQEIPLDAQEERQEVIRSTEKDKDNDSPLYKKTPKGAKWQSLTMAFPNYLEDKVDIIFKGKEKDTVFLKDLGFVDKKATKAFKPLESLILLKRFAKDKYIYSFPPRDEKQRKNLHAQVKSLRKAMEQCFGIDGDPVPPIEGGGYLPLFKAYYYDIKEKKELDTYLDNLREYFKELKNEASNTGGYSDKDRMIELKQLIETCAKEIVQRTPNIKLKDVTCTGCYEKIPLYILNSDNIQILCNNCMQAESTNEYKSKTNIDYKDNDILRSD